MNLKILDISKYQPNVDYAKVAKVIDGVILRIGITYWGKQDMGIDPLFEKHYVGFKSVGCPVGAYYYSAADSVAVAQKEAYYCSSLLRGKQFELPIFYDVENNERQGKLSKELLTQIVDTFGTQLEKDGYYVGYYSYTAWLQSKFDTAYLSKKYTLWKADYRSNYDKTIPCDMHQYTSTGKVDGIDGNVDLSTCAVDYKSIIIGNALNGFTKLDADIYNANDKKENQPTIVDGLSTEPNKLIIGAMSKGDVLTMTNYLDGLLIGYEVTVEGYVITDVPVSFGDKKAIKAKADKIGNIPVKDYVPNFENPAECAECDLLAEKIKELEMALVAENDAKVYLTAQLEIEKNKILSKDVELLATNKSLSAIRETVDCLTAENAELKTIINGVKELVNKFYKN